MLLYEFTGVDPLLVSLVAVIGQLKSSIDAGEEKPDWTVDELLEYLQRSNIIIDKSDLYDMVQGPPLNHSIENIQGDQVVFKGQGSGLDTDGMEQDAEKKKEVVKTMAKRAAS